MNIYNRIKSASAEFTDIPQYFICAYVFDGLLDKEKFQQSFSTMAKIVYPKLACANNQTTLAINPVLFFDDCDDLDLAAETITSNDYARIIQQQQYAPLIALVFFNPTSNKTLLWYWVNHVYSDVSSAKILHLAIINSYNGMAVKQNQALQKTHYLSDADFLQQSLAKTSKNTANKYLLLAKEIINGSLLSAPWHNAKRLMFNKRQHGTAIVFQRFSFDKQALAQSGASNMAYLSAIIAHSYIQAFKVKQASFVVPVDMRSRSLRWLLGNPIGGAYIRILQSQSISDSAQLIDTTLQRYQQTPLLYWLYQLVAQRMARMTDKTIYQNTDKYAAKSHFISTYLGNISRCNGQIIEPADHPLVNNYCYSYPLQTNIAISFSVSYFADTISVNLSASEHAFSHEQQLQFAASLKDFLACDVQMLRPLR